MTDEDKSAETVADRRKRRIEEARAKLASKQSPEADPEQPRPGDDTAATGPDVAALPAPGPDAPVVGPAARPDPQPGSSKKIPAGIEVVDIAGDPLVRLLRKRFGPGVAAAVSLVGQRIVTVTADAQPDVLRFLKTDAEAGFALLLDVTAVHRPEDARPFEVVYQLVAPRTGARLRVKVELADGESIASAVAVWPTANWLEREVFDLFGIVFEGHPDLRRILLPEGWEGHPLRKEYPVEYRENRWVREHLNIVEIPPGAGFSGGFEV